MKEIYYATGNPAKFEEVKLFFDDYPEIELKQFDHDLIEPQSDNQKEIALFKAEQAWDMLQKPVLVDDSGIFFSKYKNFPGTFTKYIYQSLGMENIAKLYDEGDKANFELNLVYYYGPNKYKIFEQKNVGTLLKFDQYNEDPNAPFEYVFVPEDSDKTYTQLRREGEIKKYKYRIHALKHFMEWYKRGE